jgi:hypothetical protein
MPPVIPAPNDTVWFITVTFLVTCVASAVVLRRWWIGRRRRRQQSRGFDVLRRD